MANKKSDYQTCCFEAYTRLFVLSTAAPRAVHCSPQSVGSFETYLGPTIYADEHVQHTVSIFCLHNPHPLLCKDLWSSQDTLLCPSRGAPYFWNLVKKFILLSPQGFSVCLFLALCCFWSLRNYSVTNEGNGTFGLSTSTSHRCHTLGVRELGEPSPALERKPWFHSF